MRIKPSLDSPQHRGSVGIEFRWIGKNGTRAASGLPALAVERISTVARHGPHVRKPPHDGAMPAQKRQHRVRKIIAVRVVELNHISFPEPRMAQQPERRWIEKILQAQLSERSSKKPIDRRERPRDWPHVRVVSDLGPHHHSRLHSQTPESGVYTISRAA